MTLSTQTSLPYRWYLFLEFDKSTPCRFTILSDPTPTFYPEYSTRLIGPLGRCQFSKDTTLINRTFTQFFDQVQKLPTDEKIYLSRTLEQLGHNVNNDAVVPSHRSYLFLRLNGLKPIEFQWCENPLIALTTSSIHHLGPLGRSEHIIDLQAFNRTMTSFFDEFLELSPDQTEFYASNLAFYAHLM